MMTSRHDHPPAGCTIRTIRLVGVLTLLAAPAAARVALWHPSMYGFEVGIADATRAAEGFKNAAYKDWWLHNAAHQLPGSGEFLELPAGGQFEGQIASSKAFTTFGFCEGDDLDKIPANSCALGLSYSSNVNELHPNNFTVISVRHDCSKPDVFFDIPQNLPACPEKGCHCLWGASDGTNMYTNVYRCRINGGFPGKPGANPMPRPQPPRACRGSPELCTKGAKQMVFFGQKEGNNVPGVGHFNTDFGFAEGAQKDIWQTDERKLTATVGAPTATAKLAARDWDKKWYRETWSEKELNAKWTDEEQSYIDTELKDYWHIIMNREDYGVIPYDDLSVPAQYIVRKLRAQIWLATHTLTAMPKTTRAAKPKPTDTNAHASSVIAALKKIAEKGGEIKKKQEEEKKKQDEGKKHPSFAEQKKQEEEEKKKKEEEEKKKAGEKKVDEQRSGDSGAKEISWGYAHLNDYIRRMAGEMKSLNRKQIDMLRESHEEMKKDENYPPDLLKWWDKLKGLSDDGKRKKRRDDTDFPRPTAFPDDRKQREAFQIWQITNTMNVEDVQTTQLLMLKPKPTPTPTKTAAWKPTGTYPSLWQYWLDEIRHDPKFKISGGQQRFIDGVRFQEEQGWKGPWDQQIWDAIYSMRHKQKRWWKDEKGNIALEDWDTRTYRDPFDFDRWTRKIEWTDDEIRGITTSEMPHYRELVHKVEGLGGWNSGVLKKPDRELNEVVHIRWPEIYLLRKIRFTKKKLRESVEEYFDEHRWRRSAIPGERRRSRMVPE